MPKHMYLPEIDSNIGEPPVAGQWSAYDRKIMLAISDGIVISEGAQGRGVSSVPDVWARPLMFQSAIRPDSQHPLRERLVQEWRGLLSLLALHKLHFFPSEPRDLVAITPAIVAQLEPILLSEPVNQPQKWLKAKQGSATPTFLEALKNFMYWENYDVRVRMDGKIDKVVLDDILKKRKR